MDIIGRKVPYGQVAHVMTHGQKRSRSDRIGFQVVRNADSKNFVYSETNRFSEA